MSRCENIEMYYRLNLSDYLADNFGEETMAATEKEDPFDRLGLAMTGGGARGAYQAGVLKRIGEIKLLEDQPGPFRIIGGASAGALNGSAVAVGNHDFRRCTKWMAQLWASLRTQDVYRSDLGSLVPKAGRWIRDLSLGAIFGGGHAHALLDASPLPNFLRQHINCNVIQDNINRGNLKALSVAATNYNNGKTFFFIQAHEQQKYWIKSRRVAVKTKIQIEHICASAAIPIVFQPVKVDTEYGTHYFGDGCLRLATPLSPVIRLGAERILAIGVRAANAPEVKPTSSQPVGEPPPLAQILGVTLNAIFLDLLDADVEHLERLNEIVLSGKLNLKKMAEINEPIRTVTPLVVAPSQDLGNMAGDYSHKLPAPVRYLMAGLGTRMTTSADLVSYLLFDTDYTKALIDLGYKDASEKIDEIESFIFDKI